MISFNRPVEDHLKSLTQYLPNGRTFEAKNVSDSNMRKLFRGLSYEFFRAQGYITTLTNEFFPNSTNMFIEEWESALGIPDHCFQTTGTIQERQRNIIVKLAMLGVQTKEDFINIADLFGIDVEIIPGIQVALFPIRFSYIFFSSASDARYTIIVNINTAIESKFPYSFPLSFVDSRIAIIRCIFESLKPSNCNFIMRQVG